jgi:antitoxin ParD1/3/4
MSDFERISVLLPADLARAVRAAVDGKRYAAENDVLIDAVQDWELKQRLRAEKLERLRTLIQEGIDSGSAPLTHDEIEQIKKEGRAILATRSAAE